MQEKKTWLAEIKFTSFITKATLNRNKILLQKNEVIFAHLSFGLKFVHL